MGAGTSADSATAPGADSVSEIAGTLESLEMVAVDDEAPVMAVEPAGTEVAEASLCLRLALAAARRAASRSCRMTLRIRRKKAWLEVLLVSDPIEGS